MAPHAQDLDNLLLLQDMINQTVLNIDAPRICTSKITYQLFIGRRISERILRKQRKKLLRFWF